MHTPDGIDTEIQRRLLQVTLRNSARSVVLLMVAVDEMSYEEAAALLTVPVGTVRSRLSRARAALKDKLLARGVTLDF